MTHKRISRTLKPVKAEYFNPVKELNKSIARVGNVNVTRNAVSKIHKFDLLKNQSDRLRLITHLTHARQSTPQPQVFGVESGRVCSMRKKRRSVLFAFKKLGKGKGIRSPRKHTILSKVRCI